ncbi:PREDICTED: general transcription factor IIH subunit 2-like protein [Cercocebus atys]|uniref:general transcription factor IIH subunit 2-like protein n=1 Tax=Cercocebus atys TaxID=9531 RepID=UPI0005F4AA82|nr:PREDICTED: general transcription factor IIH subunit 2-like protein [Cercocebus atys]
MDEEPERTKRWEGGYERTWEILKEDESGSLKATIEDILFKAKRKRVFEHHGQVRLGMMRHLYVVVDGSRTMEDQDLKPNRLTCTLKLLEYFVEEYFDQNPISQIGIIVTKSKRAEKLTELSESLDMTLSNGEAGLLYNSLSMAMQTLRHMPGHTSREVLIIFSSLTTCDPSNIYDLIKTLKAAKIRVSVIGLSAEVRVCTVLLETSLSLFFFSLQVYVCAVCQNVFCVDCDVFVHDSLHCCPGCIHKIPAPSGV